MPQPDRQKPGFLHRARAHFFAGGPADGRDGIAFLALGLIAAALILASLVAIGALLVQTLIGTLSLDTGEGANPRDAQIRNYALVLAAVGTAIFALWRAVIAEKQTRIADQNRELSEQRHITERFIKAVELLGAMRGENPALEQRLGAIYALERLARESLDDHIQIMETLCAYIRENASGKDLAPWPGAVLRDLEDLDWDLSDEEIESSESFQKANKATAFSVAELREDRGGCLRGWVVTLAPPRVDIRAALEVIGRRSKTQIARERADGYRLDLRETCLRRADLTGMDLGKARLDGARLEGVDNIPERVTETGGLEAAVILEGADLVAARMDGATLWGARMNGAILSWARIEGVRLGWARMEDLDLRYARMDGTDLYAARMAGANLSYSRLTSDTNDGNALRSTNLNAGKCDGGALRFVDFREATVDRKFFRNSFGDATVLLPEGIDPPPQWSRERLDDNAFFSHWRGWIEAGPRADIWGGMPTNGYKDVSPIPPPEGVVWEDEDPPDDEG